MRMKMITHSKPNEVSQIIKSPPNSNVSWNQIKSHGKGNYTVSCKWYHSARINLKPKGNLTIVTMEPGLYYTSVYLILLAFLTGQLIVAPFLIVLPFFVIYLLTPYFLTKPLMNEIKVFLISNQGKPANKDLQYSEDGFWKLVDGDWIPTEKQLSAINDGAIPHEIESN